MLTLGRNLKVKVTLHKTAFHYKDLFLKQQLVHGYRFSVILCVFGKTNLSITSAIIIRLTK